MTRKEQIEQAVIKLNPYDDVHDYEEHGTFPDAFVKGAEWADNNPSNFSNIPLDIHDNCNEKLEMVIEALRSAKHGLSTALELEDLECRNDEDCDHCQIYWSDNVVKQVLDQIDATKA